MWFILFHSSHQPSTAWPPHPRPSSLRGWASVGLTPTTNTGAEKVLLSFHPTILCQSVAKSNLCLKTPVCTLFGKGLGFARLIRLWESLVVRDSTWGMMGRVRMGFGAASGLQCSRLFTIVNSAPCLGILAASGDCERKTHFLRMKKSCHTSRRQLSFTCLKTA